MSSCIRGHYVKSEMGVSDKWEIVDVKKTYANGEIKNSSYAVNTETGYCFKSVGGTFGTNALRHIGYAAAIAYPLYGAVSIIWHLGRIPYDICRVAYEAFSQLSTDFQSGGLLYATGYFVKRIIIDIPLAVIEDIWKALKDPFFAVTLCVCSIFTIFFPMTGREYLISELELAWHDDVTYEKDFRNTLDQEDNKYKIAQNMPEYVCWGKKALESAKKLFDEIKVNKERKYADAFNLLHPHFPEGVYLANLVNFEAFVKSVKLPALKKFLQDLPEEQRYLDGGYGLVKFLLDYMRIYQNGSIAYEEMQQLKNNSDPNQDEYLERLKTLLNRKGVNLTKSYEDFLRDSDNDSKLRNISHQFPSFLSNVKMFWNAARAAKVCYLGWCFQSRGNVQEANIQLINPSEELKKKLSNNGVKFNLA